MEGATRVHLRLRSDGSDVVLTEFLVMDVRLVATRARSDLEVGLELVSAAYVAANAARRPPPSPAA